MRGLGLKGCGQGCEDARGGQYSWLSTSSGFMSVASTNCRWKTGIWGETYIVAHVYYVVRPMVVALMLNMYKLFCHYSLKYSITIQTFQ